MLYVGNDPTVTVHNQALLAKSAGVRAVHGDIRAPYGIFTSPALKEFIDFGQPVGVLFVAVLHFIADDDAPEALVKTFKSYMVPGSYLALSHITSDGTDPKVMTAIQDAYAHASAPVVFRTRAQIAAFFTGLELEPPGLVDVTGWFPFARTAPAQPPAVGFVGGIGRMTGGLPRTLPDRYSAAGTSRPGCPGVVVHQRAELLTGLGLAGAEQAGDFTQPGLTVGVQADGQRVRRGVGPQPGSAWGDHPVGEDGGLGGPLPGRVELFQCIHRRCVGVAAEPALRWGDPRHDRLAGGRVGPPGAPQREPVQRAVCAQVAVIAVAESGAQAFCLWGVFGGGGLGVQQGDGGAAEGQQGAQFGGLGAGDLEPDRGAVGDLGERAVGVGLFVG